MLKTRVSLFAIAASAGLAATANAQTLTPPNFSVTGQGVYAYPSAYTQTVSGSGNVVGFRITGSALEALGGNWQSDLQMELTSPSGHTLVIGGYLTPVGWTDVPHFGEPPAESAAAQMFDATYDYSQFGAINGTWSVNFLNTWTGSAFWNDLQITLLTSFPEGACCLSSGSCVIATAANCAGQGGVYQGDNTTCGSCPSPAGPAVALDLINATPQFLLFPANFPSTSNTLPTVFDGFAMDFNTDATVLYGISYPGNEFGTVNPDTGAFTSIGFISGAGAGETNWSGLSVDPTSGTIYAAAVTAAGSNLYTVNAATGATTLVGSMGIDLIIDIAFDNQGVLYATSISTDNLFTVDKTNGALTLVGPLGVNLNFAQGMDFDYATNTLYAAAYTTAGSYGTIDTTTGAYTALAATFPEAELAIRVPLNSGPQCYANCDESTQNPVLNVADFSCFLTKFAANDPYANCDGSTQQPVLNVADFSCFLTKFAAGCP